MSEPTLDGRPPTPGMAEFDGHVSGMAAPLPGIWWCPYPEYLPTGRMLETGRPSPYPEG